MQLKCKHIFCQACLQELFQGTGYKCPFDTSPLSPASVFDQGITNQVEFVLACPQIYSVPEQVQYLNTLFDAMRDSINFKNVPCRLWTSTGKCDVSCCPYSEHISALSSKPCPLGQTCHRLQNCPYAHTAPLPVPSHLGNSTPSKNRTPTAPAEQTAPAAFQYHIFPGWFHGQHPTKPTLVVLKSTDSKYQRVLNEFKHTSPSKTIVKIERIQSKRLYTNYAFKHESFSQNEGKNLEIKLLFHGTSDRDPALIYNSDMGLDSRLGHGSWGQGSYFAKNSSYSVANFEHKLHKGLRQILACRVIVGNSVTLAPDKTLTRPPMIPGTQKSYHTVKGSTGGSDVYITYEPAMSYPNYLITYR